jgi:hypothetical protein
MHQILYLKIRSLNLASLYRVAIRLIRLPSCAEFFFH